MKRLLITLILLLILFSSCEKDNPIIFEETKTYYEITVDEAFNVVLAANHTTYYRWYWANSQTVQIVDSIGCNYVCSTTDPEIAGSGGAEIWTFKGVEKGLDSLVMEHRERPFPNAPDVIPIIVDSKTIVVKVE